MEPIEIFRKIFLDYLIKLGIILGMPIHDEVFHVKPLGYTMASGISTYIIFSFYTMIFFDVDLALQSISCIGLAIQVRDLNINETNHILMWK